MRMLCFFVPCLLFGIIFSEETDCNCLDCKVLSGEYTGIWQLDTDVGACAGHSCLYVKDGVRKCFCDPGPVGYSECADSCRKCPQGGVPGGYETYDHATQEFNQLWGNITSMGQLLSVNVTELEKKVAILMEEIATLRTRVAELETPMVFNCAFMSGDVSTSTSSLSPYTCHVNEGNVVDASSGVFTVPKTGKYRLTFMALNVPLNQKKVICILTKTSSGVKTNIARSVAQTRLGDLEEQITTTIDVIHEFLKGDTVRVEITVKQDAKIVGTDSSKPQQVTFTGEFIRS